MGIFKSTAYELKSGNRGTRKDSSYTYLKIISKIFIIVVLIILCIFFSGCFKNKGRKTKNSKIKKIEKTENQTFVGFSMANLTEERWLKNKELFEKTAKERNIRLKVENANNDKKKQYEQVRKLIHEAIEVLIIVPIDGNSDWARECIKTAIDNNVKVIYYDRFITNAGSEGADNTYISYDNRKAGELVGEYMSKKVSKGNYAILNGSTEKYENKIFEEGYMSKLKKYIDNKDINIVEKKYVNDCSKEVAVNFIDKIYKEDKKNINAIILPNDDMADATIEKLSILRKDVPSVAISGQNANVNAYQRIEDGMQYMTIYKPIQEMVNITLDTCEKMAKNEKITTNATEFVNDGTYDIPFIKVDVEVVTNENVKEITNNDVFYTKND